MTATELSLEELENAFRRLLMELLELPTGESIQGINDFTSIPGRNFVGAELIRENSQENPFSPSFIFALKIRHHNRSVILGYAEKIKQLHSISTFPTAKDEIPMQQVVVQEISLSQEVSGGTFLYDIQTNCQLFF